MKTSRLLSLCIALAALPLGAMQAPSAPAAAGHQASSPQATAAAQEFLEIIRDMNAIAASDKPMAEKTEAIRALKPRAAELSEQVAAIGMGEVQQAVMAMVTPEDEEIFTGALSQASRADADFRAAADDIGAIILGMPTADTVPADIALSLRMTLSEGLELLKDDSLPAPTKAARLNTLMNKLEGFGTWAKKGGDTAAVAAILKENEDFRKLAVQIREYATQSAGNEAQDENLRMATMMVVADMARCMGEFYGRHQQDGMEAPAQDEAISPEVTAAAQEFLEIIRELSAIAQSGSSTAEKAAAIRALKPRTEAFGKAHGRVCDHRIEVAMETMVGEDALDDIYGTIEEMAREDELKAALREWEECITANTPPDANEEIIETEDGPAVVVSEEDDIVRAEEPASEEARAAARLMENLVVELYGIVTSGKTVDEQAAAILALKPRGEEIAKARRALGMSEIRRAAMQMMTDEKMEALSDYSNVIDKAGKDEVIDAALEELSAVIDGCLAPSTPPEEVAAAFLALLREGAELAQSVEEVPLAERTKRLEILDERLLSIGGWEGDYKAVADILIANADTKALLDAQVAFEAWIPMGGKDAAMAVLSYLNRFNMMREMFYDDHLPKPPPSAQALELAKRALALAEKVHGIATSDKGKDEKLADLNALEGEARDIGMGVYREGRGEVVRAIEGLYTAGERDQRLFDLDNAADAEAMQPVIARLVSLMNGGDPDIDEDEDYEEDYEEDDELRELMHGEGEAEEMVKQERPEAPRVEPSAEAKAAGQASQELLDAMLAVLKSDQGVEQKCEGLRALKPQAAKLGEAMKAVGVSDLRNLGKDTLKVLSDRYEQVGELMSDPRLAAVAEELDCLMRGQGDLANPASATEMAGELLAVLNEYAALMERCTSFEALEENADALFLLRERVSYCGHWLKRTGQRDEMLGLLQQEDRLKKALDRVEAGIRQRARAKQHPFEGYDEIFRIFVDGLMEQLGVTATPLSAPQVPEEEAAETLFED